MSLLASAGTCCGLVCSVSVLYLIGRRLMPPLSLTQEKYACAIPVMPVKSVPGCLVTIAPSVMGSPLAFLPLPRPHFDAVALLVLAVPPPVEPFPPQAATSVRRQLARAANPTDDRDLRNPTLMPNLLLLSQSDAGPPGAACDLRRSTRAVSPRHLAGVNIYVTLCGTLLHPPIFSAREALSCERTFCIPAHGQGPQTSPTRILGRTPGAWRGNR